MTDFHRVASTRDLAPGEMMAVNAEGEALALYRVGDTYYATSDICTHRRARLSDGFLEGTTIQCPLHFGKFDVVTGHPVNLPCKIPVETFATRVEGDDVLVEVRAR